MSKPDVQEQLNKKILILDGAMGTMLQQANLSPEDFGGEKLDGCNENLVITRPDIVTHIHRSYLEAGADIIETNTFGATSVVLAEYDLQAKAREINLEAARLAVNEANAFSSEQWPRYVAGAIGPTTKTLSVTGGVSFDELLESYFEQAVALIDGGVDLILLETSQDTLNVKAANIAIQKAFEQTGKELPVMISGTIEPMGTTLAGQTIESFYISLEHYRPVSIGLNCATGPEFMRDHIRTLSEVADTAVSCYPNAGLPDEEGHYHESPESLAKKMAGFAEQGWINIAGGCCGTTPDHIRELANVLKDYSPRTDYGDHPAAVSGIETVYVEEDNRPLMVGERTNVLGSRKFKRLIGEEKYEEASEVARAQVKRGAHVIDINLQDTERDEYKDMENFLRLVTRKVKTPLMIDSTDHGVIELGLKYSQGKALINSINLEDGEDRYQKVVPLIHRYGAAVVVGLIDEKGMAVWADDKVRVAKRSYDLLVNKYGVNPEDIIFDPNVFPVGSGDPQYIGSAKATIDGIRMVKEELPACKTILGVSNISFGLPNAGREVLNSVYLYHATKAGLDYAIVNTEKLERYASIPEEERNLSEALLFDTSEQTLANFVTHFRHKKVGEQKVAQSNLTLEERLANYIIEGSKDGLIKDLDEAVKKYKPLDIINGPLMDGMAEVGRLFNNNELIVAEVLQSAESMKASVAHLEPLMEKTDSSNKAKILLATVKGDVHDIGKNLVEIILSNNGFEIVNLGIKVPPEQLIEAYHREQPDAIGLSGLLVKSAQQMVTTVQDLKTAGIDVPVLVGGAALSRKFTRTKIMPEYDGLVLYAKDAMNGLDLANQLSNQEQRKKLTEEIRQLKESEVMTLGKDRSKPSNKKYRTERSHISTDAPIYIPPDYERHILRDYPLDHLAPYINWQMLLGHHLGLRGRVDKLLARGDEKALELKRIVDQMMADAKKENILIPKAMYRFFPAQSNGNDIYVYDPEQPDKILQSFTFPRQQVKPFLCIADYLKSKDSGEMDVVGFLVVTAGEGISAKAEEWKEKGDYLRSHVLQALALELAEAFAERVHHMMRDVWGFPDPPQMTMRERHAARYQGIRVSYGYPACPDLEDQKQLFALMKPEDIGVQLTEGCMMEPEASVSAMVFSHPEAQYFNVDKVES